MAHSPLPRRAPLPATAPDDDFTLDLGSRHSELNPGDRLGNWTLCQELGSGGMGRVFRAERSDGHYQQQAAVKLLLGWNQDDGLAQLARERQILAGLQHPNIARLIDGGTTPLGHPYLVMDYVDGVPLHQHCRTQRLGLAAVLALYGQVLQAVAAAHRQLVVHCDLKPGNVLVTPEGRAMLLDFGIARLQGPGAASETLHDVVTWTPRYASPEQKRGAKPGVASDIYSLGRMLEDLLEPLALPAGRVREWRAICARATADNPEQRYASVEALADDLARLQAHRPLRALPRTPAYRLAKLLRRRWPWALVALAGVVLSAGFTLRVVHERDRALAAERRAVAQAEATRAVSDFVVSLFEGADPATSGRPDLPAQVLLERGRERIDTGMARQPGLQAGLKTVLGKTFENLGRPTEAQDLYRQAADLAGRPDVAQPAQRAQALSRLAVLLANDSRPAEALAPAREALALLRALPPAEPEALADALNTLGIVLTGTRAFDEAETALREALALREARFGPDSHLAAITLHNLGYLAYHRQQPAQAEANLRQSLARKQQALSAQHPSVLVTQELLGRAVAQQRRYAEAEQLFAGALAMRRHLYGGDNEKTASTLNELGNVLQDQGQVAAAEQHYREAVQVHARLDGGRGMGRAIALNNLATVLEEQGRLHDAAQAFRDSLALRLKLLAPDDLGVARTQHNLGRLHVRAGQPALARPLVEQAAATRARRLAATHRDRVDTQVLQAELAAAEGQLPLLQQQVQALQPLARQLSPQRQLGWQLLLARERVLAGDGAAAFEPLRQALDAARPLLPPQHVDVQHAWLLLAETAAARGDPVAARQALQQLQPLLAPHEATSPLRVQALALQRRLGR